jgi:hypothetical protein
MSLNFFKSESERSLWIKLNAERLSYKTYLSGGERKEIGNINDVLSHMSQSNNQLLYDENVGGNLRFTLEELLLPEEDLFYLAKNRDERVMNELFNACKKNDNPELFPEH